MDMTRRLVRLGLTANALAMIMWLFFLPKDISSAQLQITGIILGLNALGLIVSGLVWWRALKQ